MNVSARSKQPLKIRSNVIPLPRPRGISALLLALFCFFTGKQHSELALLALSFLLFLPLVYSFFALFTLALLHNRKIRRLAVKILPEKVRAGMSVTLFLQGRSGSPGAQQTGFFELPAILLRYQLKLLTKDHRELRRFLARDFFTKREASFCAERRGAYFGRSDEVRLFDIFGFFHISYHLPCGEDPRLLVSPALGAESAPVTGRAGGVDHRGEQSVTRTDDLIEQRPYVPGDDPRRINWKLYGHVGDLFVREENHEPPPHGRLVILVYTETHAPSKNARGDVDMLCEQAQAIALWYGAKGIEVFIGSNGAALRGGTPEECAWALALPYAVPAGKGGTEERLPRAEDEKHLVLLAAPSPGTPEKQEKTALDCFLMEKPRAQKIELLLFCRNEADRDKVEALAQTYQKSEGVYAKAIHI